MKNSFFLVIPIQKRNAERSKCFEESALKQWIMELPTANPDLAARLLHDLIEGANRLEMDAKARLEALEILRPSYLMITEYLLSGFCRSGFPKNEMERQNFNFLLSIEKEFAIGYWIVARELTKRDVSWLKGKNAAISIQRVIKGLGCIAKAHYLMFLPVPEWVWMDLHSLYTLSVKIGKDTTKVPDETCIFGKTSSVLDSYRQILLLSLAEPSGMMQKEIQLVYKFIERINGYVRFENEPVDGQKSQCVVFPDEDRPPFWTTEDKRPVDASLVYLDFSRLYKTVAHKTRFVSESEARFSSIHPSNKKIEKLPVELIEYLNGSWYGLELKGTPFFTDRLNRYFCIGLNATHNLQSLFDNHTEKDTEFRAESSSDTTLSCKSLEEGVICIGSLVSFRKVDMPEHKRSLGVVNRISMARADGVLQFGVRAVALQAHAVSYLELDARNVDEMQKALIYGKKEEDGEKSYLIIESFIIKDGDIIRLFMKDEDFPIILRDRKNIGLGYWQFECRRIEEWEAVKMKR